MNPSKGYYSLIQYCPDLGRLEAASYRTQKELFYGSNRSYEPGERHLSPQLRLPSGTRGPEGTCVSAMSTLQSRGDLDVGPSHGRESWSLDNNRLQH
jgi:hypothetical protein